MAVNYTRETGINHVYLHIHVSMPRIWTDVSDLEPVGHASVCVAGFTATRDFVSFLSPVNYTSIEHQERNRAATHTPRRIWSRALSCPDHLSILNTHCVPVPLIQDWIICICAKIKISVVDFFLFQSSKINSSTIRSIETSIWLPFVISMQTTLYFVFKRIKSLSLG